MSRSFLTNIHLYIAALFAPVLVMMACSGGLYLLGVKGNVNETAIELPADTEFNFKSPTVEQDLADLLAAAGEPHAFEYTKSRGSSLITRPTSRQSYKLSQSGAALQLTRLTPDFQASLIELHKGHGPQVFRTFQKLMAAGLVVVLVSGVWLGLSSRRLRVPTLLTSAVGLALFVVFGFVL
ncbi:MAG: PepSY domain-containing protein [Halioglobus sp.]